MSGVTPHALIFVVPFVEAMPPLYRDLKRANAADGIACEEIRLTDAQSYEALLDRLQEGMVPIVVKP